MLMKQEAAIVSAYTGFLLGSFNDMHEYAEKIMGRPIYTHEFADKILVEELKQKAKQDFITISVEPS